MKKKIFRAILAAALACCLLAGCGLFARPACTVTVVASYGGTDEGGQDLPSGERTETFQARQGDYFGEDVNGHWYLNDGEYRETAVLTLKKVGDCDLTLYVQGKEIVCGYGEPVDIPSCWMVCDGLNYSYRVTFSPAEE